MPFWSVFHQHKSLPLLYRFSSAREREKNSLAKRRRYSTIHVLPQERFYFPARNADTLHRLRTEMKLLALIKYQDARKTFDTFLDLFLDYFWPISFFQRIRFRLLNEPIYVKIRSFNFIFNFI